MSANRPPNPALKHFRNDAKQLLKALKTGSREAAARIAEHLPRLSGSSVEDVLAADVGLQEAQHVVAREHGYAQWKDLPEADGHDFEDLVRLSDAEIRVLLREVGEQDLALALKALEKGALSVTHQVVFGLLQQLPEPVRASLRRDVQVLDAGDDQIEEALVRIAQQAGQLHNLGYLLRWPPKDGATSDASPKPSMPRPAEADVLLEPLDSLDLDQLRQGLMALSSACGHDLTALEGMIPEDERGFLWDHLRHVVDHTEPELLRHLLETRAGTLTHHTESRLKMLVEGMASIATGDNPRMVAHKLSRMYYQETPRAYREPEGTVELAVTRLQTHPASRMSLHELVEFIVDLAWINWRASAVSEAGCAVLSQVADAVDDEFMARGLRTLAERGRFQKELTPEYRGEVNRMVEELETESVREVERVRRRYRLVTNGIVAIREGKREAELDAAMAA